MRDIVIVMMGQDFKETPALLQSLLASDKYTARVKIFSPITFEELLDWTALYDIGLNVLLSDYTMSVRKFFPNKSFEFLMADLPVLSTELNTIVEVIISFEVEGIVPSIASEDICVVIKAMITHYDGLVRISSNALEAARMEFYFGK